MKDFFYAINKKQELMIVTLINKFEMFFCVTMVINLIVHYYLWILPALSPYISVFCKNCEYTHLFSIVKTKNITNCEDSLSAFFGK